MKTKSQKSNEKKEDKMHEDKKHDMKLIIAVVKKGALKKGRDNGKVKVKK